MDKQRKKELLAQFKKQENEKVLSGLNTDIQNIHDLLDYIDEYLEENDCDDTLSATTKFLKENDIEIESTLNWLKNNGGYCDCEVLANIEDKIEDL